ncbi:MAG: MarC family protein [Candidatus Cyclobacteriaceae bacterium M2_1C_046]
MLFLEGCENLGELWQRQPIIEVDSWHQEVGFDFLREALFKKIIYSMNWQLYLNFILALLALINPITRLPLWKEMTGDTERKARKQIAVYVVFTALLILLIFLFTGHYILSFFGVDLSVFKFGGGILLLISGIAMVNGSMTKLENRKEEGDLKQKAKKRFNKVVVPLAFPLLAGPGAITTVIIYGSKAEGWIDYTMLSAVVVITLLIILIFFFTSNIAERKVDDTVFSVLIRVFGILVVAIGSQFIVEGLGEVFPAWLEAAERSDIEDNSTEVSESEK